MNLKKSGRILWIVAAVAMLAMVLQGCGGDDGVSPTTHQDLQDELDQVTAQRDALQATLGDETDPAPESVRGMLAAAQADATMYMNMAANLQTTLGDEMDPAADSVRGMLAAAQADATMYMNMAANLQATLGDETDPAADSVRGMLAAAQADVTMYMTLLGDETDPAADSVRGMLAAANADVETYMNMAANLQTTLGDEMDPAADSVRGMLAAANADVETYMDMVDSLQTTLGDETDPAADSVRGMLAAANARIGSEDDPESLLGQIADLEDRVAELQAGTAPDLLDPIKMAASNAADAAETASGAAGDAADAAEMAAENRATMQTGMANSVMDAATARMHADTAMTEAGNARTASDDAQAATSVDDATPHRTAAETAQANAVTAQGMAESARDDAVADAAMELKIDGSMKSVGGTSVDDTAGASSITVNGETTITGRLADGEQPNQTVIAFAGQTFANTAGSPPNPNTPYRQAYDQRAFDIGKTLDSDDDTARLMLVTQYAGTMAVNVYSLGAAASTQEGTESGRISIDEGGGETNNVVLRSEGMHYRAGDDTDANLTATDSVANDAEGVEVFSYVDPTDDLKKYVVLTTTETTGGDTTWTYTDVDVTAAAVDADDDGTAEQIQITVDIPAAVDYDHIEFGVWAALGEAATDGSQDVDDLGIGFVQNHSGMGMTGADMPNNGTAAYSGNWVATVQSRHANGEGAIALINGSASLSADFGDGDFTATLDNLAVLEGNIAGNTFSGTEVTSVADTRLNTTADAGDTYTGSFSGGFYGSKAAEAGGVFDFMSDGMEDGGFRGAFGAARD